MKENKDLKIIALKSSLSLAEKVNQQLEEWEKENKGSSKSHFIKSQCPRFGTGEAKGIVEESIRGKDLYIMVDVCNHNIPYTLFGKQSYMSPDDHYQDLKRIIGACNGKANKITVIMPFLYESRQHKRNGRESLDCAIMLNELVSIGVKDIITFDAHDARVQNAIPYNSLENVSPIYQFLTTFLPKEKINIDKDELIIISPDEGATNRAIKLASILEVGMGMFYKERDYSKVIEGRNPIIAHEYLGPDLSGKSVIVIDDMISSGESMLDVCEQLKVRKAEKIYIFSTFGLFTKGFDKFDKAFESGLFEKIYTTNGIYQMPELLEKPYYESVHLESYIAALIDSLNKSKSISNLINPIQKSKEYIKDYKKENLY